MTESGIDFGKIANTAEDAGTAEREPHHDPDGDPTEEPEPRILPRPEHSVSRQLISSGALKVLYRLHNAGFKAYLVGGGVRDLLLGARPKDFDVATDAKPQEIRRLFKNARIIGRRFRLAHIIFRDGIVEVSTFRSQPDPDAQKGGPDELLITDDNRFGTPLEDAFRRDFTINALFYSIADFSVIDYVGGLDDIEQRSVRVIGEPEVRFCEDPVRMMRACEFAGRLGFTIEKRTQEAIQSCGTEMSKASPARLVEELLQLLKCGSAGASVQWMLELGLLDVLLPEALAMITAREKGAGDFGNVLPTLDRMINDGRELDDVVLLGAILLPHLMLQRFEFETRRRRWLEPTAFSKLVQETLKPFLERFQVANYKRARLEQALEGFHRLCSQSWTRSQRSRFAAKSYFDDALALFEILVRATGEGHDALEAWQAARRQRPRHHQPHPERRRRHRPRRKR